MTKQKLVRLSQSHLNLLSICPPKFQQVYLDGLGTIPNLQQQEGMKWGSQFHLLMQQRELTLPIEPFLTNDPQLNVSFNALVETATELFSQETDIWREAEHYRTLTYGNFIITVVYDLLIAREDRGLILDWKTYRQPRQANQLANNWQTRLYLYVLAQTSEYTPEQIQMTYWFVKSDRPKSVTFSYSQLQHQQTERDLMNLLAELETWLQNYQQHQVDFPHRSECESKCPYHQFLSSSTTEKHQELIASIDRIAEISI